MYALVSYKCMFGDFPSWWSNVSPIPRPNVTCMRPGNGTVIYTLLTTTTTRNFVSSTSKSSWRTFWGGSTQSRRQSTRPLDH